MELKRISSLLTFTYKFLVLPLFAFSYLDLFFLSKQRFGIPGGVPYIWILVVIPLVTLFALWGTWRLKWVAIDSANRRLYVSNYRKEIAIPFSEIANVTEFFFSDPKRITIHLHHPTEFGSKIVFLATYRFGGWMAGKHPIVQQLKDLSRQN